MTRRVLRGLAAVLAAASLTCGATGRTPTATALPGPPSRGGAATAPDQGAPDRAAPAPAVTLRVQDVAPTVVRPGQDLVLRVGITSTDSAVTGPLTARVLLGGSPLQGRDTLTRWLHDPVKRVSGDVVAIQPLPSVLAPRRTTTVTLTVPRDRLARGTPFGAYPLSVEVRGRSGSLGSTRSVLPWVAAAQEFEPLRLAWVAPLTLPADPHLSAGTAPQVASAWSQAVGPTGVIPSRLDAAAGTPVTWMVDPAVVSPPTEAAGLVRPEAPASTGPTPSSTSAGGTSGRGGPPTATPLAATSSTATGPATPSPSAPPSTAPPGTGPSASAPSATGPTPTASPTRSPDPARTTGSPAPSPSPGTTPPPREPGAASLASVGGQAAALAARLKDLPDDQPVWSLPPGDPDTAALLPVPVGHGLRSVVWRGGPTALDRAVGRELRKGVAWPADDAWPAGRTRAWQRVTGQGPPTAALVSTASVAGSADRTPGASQRSPDGLPLLAYDDRLSRLTGGQGAVSDAQLVQEFLGQSLTLLGERPGTRRSALVAVPRTTTMSGPALRRLWAATRSAPWLRQVPTAGLLGDADRASGTRPVPRAEPTPVDGSTAQLLEGDVVTITGLGRILPEASPVTGSWRTGVRDLASTRWRGRPAQWLTLRHAVSSSIDTTRQGVRVRPSTINFLADTGTIQITVDNTLPHAVHDVRVELVPDSPILRVDSTPRSLSVAAGSRTTTQVQVTALGSGTVPLVASLTTPDGVQLGSPATVSMRVRPTSVWVFALVAGIVGAILVLGLARSLRRGPTRAERELGDRHAVADAILGTRRSTPVPPKETP